MTTIITTITTTNKNTNTINTNACDIASLHHLQHTFVTEVLPRIEVHGRIHFRHIRCIHQREDLLAEMMALAWKWFVRLAQRGKNGLAFVSVLARYAARAVASGRRLCGQQPAGETLSVFTQRRHDFAVQSLPDFTTQNGTPFEKALQDNTVSPVPEQVAFRIDFPAWRISHAERDRRLLDQLMLGDRTLDVSRTFGLSMARISQKRRDFRRGWLSYCGEVER